MSAARPITGSHGARGARAVARRMAPWAAAVTLAASLSATPADAQQDGPPLEILHGFTLIDGRGGPPLANAGIALRGPTIVGTGSVTELRERWTGAPDVIEVDLGGGWVIPGLIDSHVHLATVPDRAEAELKLERLLYAGVTGVRDMAGDARSLAALARDALLGEIVAPDIYYSALMAGPSFFDDPRPRASSAGAAAGDVPWMQAITAETDIGRAVAHAAGTSATAIKIYADLPPEIVNRITFEAHNQGLRVWAHSMVFPTRPIEVVRAGVDVVSHVCRLAWEAMAQAPTRYHHSARPDYSGFTADAPVFTQLLELMRDRGTVLDATLAMYAREDSARTARAGDGAGGPEPECDTEFARSLVRRAHSIGVDIVAGTDFTTPPSDPWPALFIEMEELVEHGGLSPMDAIRAATAVAARALGIDERVGTLEAGKDASFVLLDRNPIEDIRHLRTVREVWKNAARYDRADHDPGIPPRRAVGTELDTSTPAAVLASWVGLWRSYDLDRVDDLFWRNDGLTYFSSEYEGVIEGFEAIVEHHRGFGFVPGGVEPSAELWVEDPVFSDLGESVVIGGVWFFGNRAARGEAQRGPMTIVLVPTPGGYRIAHMHFGNYED